MSQLDLAGNTLETLSQRGLMLGVVIQLSKLRLKLTDIKRGLTNTLSDSCDPRLVRKRHSRHQRPKILKGHLSSYTEGGRVAGPGVTGPAGEQSGVRTRALREAWVSQELIQGWGTAPFSSSSCSSAPPHPNTNRSPPGVSEPAPAAGTSPWHSTVS